MQGIAQGVFVISSTRRQYTDKKANRRRPPPPVGRGLLGRSSVWSPRKRISSSWQIELGADEAEAGDDFDENACGGRSLGRSPR